MFVCFVFNITIFVSKSIVTARNSMSVYDVRECFDFIFVLFAFENPYF